MYAQLLGWGLIPMSIKAAKAAKLREAYDNLRTQIEKYKKDREEETTLIEYVSTLIRQCESIDSKMETAIKAMTDLSGLFSEQGKCYDKIASYLRTMASTRVVKLDLVNRRNFINYNTKQAIKKLKEVSQNSNPARPKALSFPAYH
jgi:hypothetical protein